MAQVAYRSHSVAGRDGNGTLTLTKPAGTVDGDLLLTHIVSNSSTVSTLSGWTLLDSYTGGEPRTYLFYKIAASEGSSYAWSVNGDVIAGAVIAFSNPHQTLPIDVHSIKNNADSTTCTGTTITPTTAPESLLVAFTGSAKAASVSSYAVATTNPTWTEAFENGRASGLNEVNQSMAYANRDVITGTGAFTATLSVSGLNTACLLSIRPAGFSIAPPVMAITATQVVPTVASAQVVAPPAMAITATVPTPSVAEGDLKWSNQDKNSASWVNTDKT